MNGTLLRALVALIPASALFGYALVLFLRSRTVSSVFRLVGATGFVVVVFAHICEALNLLPWMGWGLEHSVGHYLDLTSAVLGAILFSTGLLLDWFSKREA